MRRLHLLETPTIWHSEARRYPNDQLTALMHLGILTMVPEPPNEGPSPRDGSWVGFSKTSRGWFAVAAEDDEFFESFPLTEEDIRLYEVDTLRVAEKIRADNEITGNGFTLAHGLVPLGEKQVTGLGVIDVSLSLPNSNLEEFSTRCLTLRRYSGIERVAVLVPVPVVLPPATRSLLDGRDVALIPLLPSTDNGHLKVNWTIVTGSKAARKPDGVRSARLVVVCGVEYRCDLTKREMDFLNLAFAQEEVEIETIWNRKDGVLWKSKFVNEKSNRDKVAKFISNLNKKLNKTQPSFPFFFMMPRGRRVITRTSEAIS